MTELMETLYDYVLDSQRTASGDEAAYHEALAQLDHLSRTLWGALPAPYQEVLKIYQDTVETRQSFELRAVFQATLAAARELFLLTPGPLPPGSQAPSSL